MRSYFAILLLLAPALVQAQGVPRSECFPVERFSAEEQAQAETLFLGILDNEGLYTVAGMKPMSSGFVRFNVSMKGLDLSGVDTARKYLEAFRCGTELFATVQHFGQTYLNSKTNEIERPFEGVVFHRGALRRSIQGHGPFFHAMGLSAHSAPMEALMAVEYITDERRNRGLGYLYGYPDYAVDFFVESSESQRATGKFVERDFRSFPSFSRDERGVVYAVPKGQDERPEDRDFGQKIEGILRDYRERRENFIGPGKRGVIAMLRDWFCGDSNLCAAPGMVAAGPAQAEPQK